MSAADRLIDDFKPAFTAQRVSGAHEGIGLVNDAIRFADPIATRRGGAAVEVPSLLRFVSDRTGQTNREVLARLRSRAPHTAALLEAIPLQSVGDELTRLLPLLARKMRMGGSRLLLTLRKATPGLAQALERVPGVTTSWNAIAGTGQLERFDGSAPVRSAVELGEYLRSDVVAALEREQAHFDKLANSWPPVNFLPPLLLAVGLFTLGYGLYGMRALARR
jgi:hypothetical protein